MRVTVNVTDTHIALGRPNCGDRCRSRWLCATLSRISRTSGRGQIHRDPDHGRPAPSIYAGGRRPIHQQLSSCTDSAEPFSAVLDFEPADPTA